MEAAADADGGRADVVHGVVDAARCDHAPGLLMRKMSFGSSGTGAAR